MNKWISKHAAHFVSTINVYLSSFYEVFFFFQIECDLEKKTVQT